MRKCKTFNVLLVLISSLPACVFGGVFRESPYSVCFTPGGQCTSIIVNQIRRAKQSIYIQAYGFTSKPIIKAVTEASRRGIEVFVILDKSNAYRKYSALKSIKSHGVSLRIDSKVAIAHNKVMILDQKTVITGSFNFTKSAQVRNAENLLIIDNRDLAKKYLDNFSFRWSQSKSVRNYCKNRHCHYE